MMLSNLSEKMVFLLNLPMVTPVEKDVVDKLIVSLIFLDTSMFLNNLLVK